MGAIITKSDTVAAAVTMPSLTSPTFDPVLNQKMVV